MRIYILFLSIASYVFFPNLFSCILALIPILDIGPNLNPTPTLILTLTSTLPLTLYLLRSIFIAIFLWV
jgi:hypothetical protein